MFKMFNTILEISDIEIEKKKANHVDGEGSIGRRASKPEHFFHPHVLRQNTICPQGPKIWILQSQVFFYINYYYIRQFLDIPNIITNYSFTSCSFHYRPL